MSENFPSSKQTNNKITPYVHEIVSKQLNSEMYKIYWNRKNLKEKNKIFFDEITTLIDKSKSQVDEKSRLEGEIENKKSYLASIKEERNRLIAEKHLLNNELEYIKVIIN